MSGRGRGVGGLCVREACACAGVDTATGGVRMSAGSKAATAHIVRHASMLMSIECPEIVGRFGVPFRSWLTVDEGLRRANKADCHELQSGLARFQPLSLQCL